jgi:hypothetical protein
MFAAKRPSDIVWQLRSVLVLKFCGAMSFAEKSPQQVAPAKGIVYFIGTVKSVSSFCERNIPVKK